MTADALTQVVRDEWGRLLALLVAQYRRLDLAEEGLADAVEAAARTWPADGTPANPQAWLLTAARRRITDHIRSERVLARKMPLLTVDAEVTAQAQRVMAGTGDMLVDERLRLVLLCSHPALSREAAAALTLRLVLGISTEEIARLFLMSTAGMAARLTRARKRLASERFAIPSGPELEYRVARVLDVAYLAFTADYVPGSDARALQAGLAGDAIRLVRVLRSVLPQPDAEVDALLALMLLQNARRDARVDDDGRIVLLPDQDRRRWRHDEIAEALDLLEPLATGPATSYLLQALIAAEHSIAQSPEETAWDRTVARYDELLDLTDSPVVRLNRAVAIAERDNAEAGLAVLARVALPGHRLPAVRAELLARAGRIAEALASYDAALALCGNEAEREHLRARRAEVEHGPR